MKALVTGGGGFLGRRIVELLLERGDEVRFINRGHYPAVEKLGAHGIQGDLRDPATVRAAVKGVDVVYHVAALAKAWGPISEFRSINVDATRHVLDAMEAEGVPRLVYTSTPSVVASGVPIVQGGPNLPYPAHNDSPYGSTKAEAEQMVLAANSAHLATVAVRPRLVFGPREDNMLPNLLDRARKGRLMIVGDGENLTDLTFIDNAAWAHLDAERALTSHTAKCAGKAYFISNGEPTKLWPWLNALLEANGIAPVTRRISLANANRVGGVMEWAWRTFGLSGEPRMTRQIATALGTEQTVDMGPAYRDLGYKIRVGLAEGTRATHQWFVEGRATVESTAGTVTFLPDEALPEAIHFGAASIGLGLTVDAPDDDGDARPIPQSMDFGPGFTLEEADPEKDE